jgi:hypothetical protein
MFSALINATIFSPFFFPPEGDRAVAWRQAEIPLQGSCLLSIGSFANRQSRTVPLENDGNNSFN